ncbi:hypothetical protein KCP70_02940 [Salmonella enterica subsp. enterica]|nr:hypothetical protein KCP70_02940 [Salmonella enterica subsp. enterica]
MPLFPRVKKKAAGFKKRLKRVDAARRGAKPIDDPAGILLLGDSQNQGERCPC